MIAYVAPDQACLRTRIKEKWIKTYGFIIDATLMMISCPARKSFKKKEIYT
jgi:hypothetical protein